MTPEGITALAGTVENIAKLIVLIMFLNAFLKIIVWHFTEGTKP